MLNVHLLWLVLLLGFGLGDAHARESACDVVVDPTACQRVGTVRGLLRPERVLIVPLLHKETGGIESERWAENPAASIERFYRNTYGARVTWLRDVHTWEEYYQQVGLLLQHPVSFDRVVFVGHGGFDGPVLNPMVYRKNLELDGGRGTLSRAIESQPGLQEAVTITYDVHANAAFSEYIADHWRELLRLGVDPVQELKQRETGLQPLHKDCADHCLSDPTVSGDKVAACDWVCRDPLFEANAGEAVAPDRFRLFAGSLRKLVAPGGLIVIGACNPGTVARESPYPWETDGLLVHSTLAGGPYPTYVHLLAAGTGRAVAGPIGKTGADYMEEFIANLEGSRSQQQVRLVVPAEGARAP